MIRFLWEPLGSTPRKEARALIAASSRSNMKADIAVCCFLLDGGDAPSLKVV